MLALGHLAGFWVAPRGVIRQTYYAESNTESTTTSTADQDKVTLTATPDANSDYFVIGCALVGFSGVTNDTRAKLVNTTSAVTFNSLNVEGKDGTDYFSVFGAGKETYGASPASQTWKWQYSTESGLQTAKIKETRALVLKAGANDKYAESLAESTTTSATPQDKVTLTETFVAGNYTFIFVADWGDDAVTTQGDVMLDIDGTDYCLQNIFIDDTSTYKSVGGIVPNITLTAASHTIKMQYNSNGAATAKIRNAKIIALYQGGFSVAQTVHQTTRDTNSTDDTYETVPGASITFTPTAKEHIIFASSLMDHSSNTSSGFNQLLEGATVIAEMQEEPSAAGEEMAFFTMYRKTLTAVSTTWAIQHKPESTGTVGTDEAAIAIFQTGA